MVDRLLVAVTELAAQSAEAAQDKHLKPMAPADNARSRESSVETMQIGIVVRDLEASQRFYSAIFEVLGIPFDKYSQAGLFPIAYTVGIVGSASFNSSSVPA